MSAFELNDNSASIFGNPNTGAGRDSRRQPSVNPPNNPPGQPGHPGQPDHPPEQIRTKTENIIAFKIYDICRQQDCLDFNTIGPARAAEEIVFDDIIICEGDIIIPPHNAASVSIEDLHIKKIVIVDKRPSGLRRGFWDVELKYIIGYKLIFRGAHFCDEKAVEAFSMFSRKVTLFGSEGGDLFVATDLFGKDGMFEAAPFIMAEAKAMALCSSLLYDCHPHHDHGHGQGSHEGRGRATSVEVVIGLFSIIKLFRLVDLAVESTGFTIPEECEDICPMDPCEFFEGLDFPMDLFAPPQKPEFSAGISSNIPAKKHQRDVEIE